jgi:acyl-CoA thioesterase
VAPHAFDVETAVTAAGDHGFHARTSPEWWGGTGPHGGHLAASVLRATMAEVGDDELSPRSFTIHFLRPAEPGELSITTETVNRGRSLASVTAEVRQGERLIAVSLAALGRDRSGPVLPDATMPKWPDPTELRGLSESARQLAPPVMSHYEYRVALGRAFVGGPALTGGWVRPAQPRQLDDLLITAYCDVWPRAIFMTLDRPVPAPTLELTINYLARPTSNDADGTRDFCAMLFETPAARHGYFREDGKIWSQDGVLLAACSQLGALIPLK